MINSIQKETYIQFNCLEAVQPIGTMYVGVMDSADLEGISYADVRRLEEGKDNRDIEDYIGIQRELSKSREKVIGKYVNLSDATFPNSIILAISSEFATYEPLEKRMSILYRKDVAKVLDGQHRIAGLRDFKKDSSKFQCIVTIYIDMDLEDQAIVFATINKEQKNVSNSLVADLFAFAESRSPQKTGHNIARVLNSNSSSPFYKKIKILGTAINKDTETITQDTFVKSIVSYISNDPQRDREFYRVNKGNKRKLELVSGKDERRYFLRNMFIQDDSDVKIAQLIWNYFFAVQMRWPDAWNHNRDSYILNKSTGFIALMKFFKDAYLSFDCVGEVVSKEAFMRIFDTIDLDQNNFTKQVYIPGTAGQSALYQDLLAHSNLS